MSNYERFSRRSYLKSVCAVGAATAAALAGCARLTRSASGTIATAVTDQPGDIADFESCIVTIESIWQPASDGPDGGADADGGNAENSTGDETATDADAVVEQDEEDIDESNGREYYEFDKSQEADLVQLQDGNTALVDEREVTAHSQSYTSASFWTNAIPRPVPRC